MSDLKVVDIEPGLRKPVVREQQSAPTVLPDAQETKVHPRDSGGENASLFFVGTATTILEWSGIRLMTDPNFLHAGDHVHLGPGVTAKRLTNPAVELESLPPIDLVLLSHYHEDHFDRVVESKLRRDVHIVTTPHARECLVDKKALADKFERVTGLDFWETCVVRSNDANGSSDGRTPSLRITGMPGKHIPPGPLSVVNDLLGAVPPTNGWMLELGQLQIREDPQSFECRYRIYISGDTLFVDELKEIPERYKGKNIDLMLVHLGGTTIPSPSMPLLMVTMDAEQGVKMMNLIHPDVTIPIHFDDYDVFRSPLVDFKRAVEEAGLQDKVVYLDRKDRYRFAVKHN